MTDRASLVEELNKTRAKLGEIRQKMNDSYAKKNGFAKGSPLSNKEFVRLRSQRYALISRITEIEGRVRDGKGPPRFERCFVDAARAMLPEETFTLLCGIAKDAQAKATTVAA